VRDITLILALLMYEVLFYYAINVIDNMSIKLVINEDGNMLIGWSVTHTEVYNALSMFTNADVNMIAITCM